MVVPAGKLAGASLVTLAPLQMLLVIGEPSGTPEAEHEPLSVPTLTGAGQVIVGGWLSTTTVCWQVLLLPCTSTTVQVTVLVPTGKVAGALLVTLATPQLSDVLGVPSATPLA